MFNLFGNKTATRQDKTASSDFNLPENSYYFDSACQSLRPEIVIKAETDFYQKFNSCGHRSNYAWAKKTDRIVEETREQLIKMVGKSTRDYTVAFTLNTTFGINQVLSQLPYQNFDKIVTSEIEHNSVFLPSLVFAKQNQKERLVLKRSEEKTGFGSLIFKKDDLKKAIGVFNLTSNIDGRTLQNAKQVCESLHSQNGILLLDACQTFSHEPELLKEVDFDACFGSGHKMYAPSMGFIIIKKSLLKSLNSSWIGGSTVSDVSLDSYELISDDKEIYARLEAGLQNYAGIIGLNAALDWMKGFEKDGKNMKQYEAELAEYLFEKLHSIKGLQFTNPNPTPTISMWSDKQDGHKLATILSQQNIMARSGYHCCHYYLIKQKKYPPLYRLSLSLFNTKDQIDFVVDKVKVVVENL